MLLLQWEWYHQYKDGYYLVSGLPPIDTSHMWVPIKCFLHVFYIYTKEVWWQDASLTNTFTTCEPITVYTLFSSMGLNLLKICSYYAKNIAYKNCSERKASKQPSRSTLAFFSRNIHVFLKSNMEVTDTLYKCEKWLTKTNKEKQHKI